MKPFTFILAALILYNPFKGSAQNRSLDFATPDSWPTISDEEISSQSGYVTYYLNARNESKFIIKSLHDSWSYQFPGATQGSVVCSQRFLVVHNKNDSLFVLNLRTKKLDSYDHIKFFRRAANDTTEWIAFSASNETIFLNLITGTKITLKDVVDFHFNDEGTFVIVETRKAADSVYEYLSALNLQNHKLQLFSKEKGPCNFLFNNRGDKIVFASNRTGSLGSEKYSILVYDLKSGRLQQLVNSDTQGLDREFEVFNKSIWKFSDVGDELFFRVKRCQGDRKIFGNSEDPGPLIWKYNERFMPDEMSKGLKDTSWLMSINLANPVCAIRIENSKQVNMGGDVYNQTTNGNVLLYRRADYAELNDSLKRRAKCYIYSGGKISKIFDSLNYVCNVELSPLGRYVIWFDQTRRAFFVYNTDAGKITNLTGSINTIFFDEKNDHYYPPESYGVMGWLPGDSAVLIYDRYDIWKFFLHENKAPINVTKGFGREHHLILRSIVARPYSADKPLPTFADLKIILSCFDEENKDNGFLEADLVNSNEPELLCKGPYAMYFPHLYPSSNAYFPYRVIKARLDSLYLLRKMSSKEYPNLYVTRNFRSFQRITDLEPQKEYNWLTAELVKWEIDKGKNAVGILYKPQNFDSTKKYPVIIYYYEKFSEELNFFLKPELSDGTLNIPHFVSNGFIVFIPDISYQLGKPGESAFRSVYSGAKFISSFYWIDSSRMGLQGHSFGGYETNYIVTKTDMFKAAVSAAGLWNLTSAYNSVRGSFGISAQYLYEIDQFRIGPSMMSNYQAYVENSPIFSINRIGTPILLMHNRDDGAVPYNQSMQGFLALRRANLPVWLVEYPGEDHTIRMSRIYQMDFSKKMFEFFNFYLKNSLKPRWMEIN